MTIDLNRLPYFDDYNEDKRYHRILFKPGVAVQARELTQMQTILQNQIERFGKHVFDEGSIVLGGAFDPQDPIDYVRVTLGSETVRNELINQKLTGLTTGLEAYVVHADADPNIDGVSVLFVRYSNASNTATTFASSEILSNSIQNITTTSTSTVGQGSIFGLGSGVVFIRGFFIKFDSQKTTLAPFSIRPSKKVYFKFEFDTVDSLADLSLLDNAQGFNNFNAPGADRLRATVTLATSDTDVTLSPENHVLLFEISNGDVKLKNERTQYARIYDELAKRTYDESGDYVVYGLNVFSREHLDTGNNEGRFVLADGGDANLISIGVEAGLAYVKGYEVNNFSTRYIDIEKSTDYVNVDNEITFVRSANYIEVNELTGIPDVDQGGIINLYDTAESRVSNNTPYSTSAAGSKIGEARIRSILINGSTMGGPESVYRIYISDLRMSGNNSFGSVRSVGNANFFADAIIGTANTAIIKDSKITDSKLINIGVNSVRNLLDTSGNSDTSLQFYRQKTGTLSSGGTVTISITTPDESMPYGTGALASLAKESIFLVIDESANVALSGNVSISTGNTSVSGVGTSFTDLNEGDRLEIDSTTYVIDTITNNTSLVLKNAATSTYSGTFQKVYIAGDIIDLNAKGADSGVDRTATATTSSITLDIKETLDTTKNCRVIHRAARNNAEQVNKILKPNRIVLIDCSSTANLNVFPLGFSDVYQIRQIRKSGSAFTTINDGTNVTSSFNFDNGQTLYSYENATISPINSSVVANTDYLLVELDYFDPDFSTGFGYFSVDSYPINDVTESSTTITTSQIPRFISDEGREYNLRNYIDIRPIKTNTANDSTTIGGASTNPALSTVYDKDSNGLRVPIPGTNITFDYSFYLARRDVLVVDKDGNFEVIKGQPAISPGIPQVSPDYMKIANLYIPPFPSISSSLARLLSRQDEAVLANKITFARHTMRDIGNIEKRVKNLEYYNALNLLEKATMDLTITDENGLERFKNGTFIDPFIDHSLGDTTDLDYKVSNDKIEKVMRPLFVMENSRAPFLNGTSIVKNDYLISLPFTETTLLEQSDVTTSRNIEYSSYRFIGDLQLVPSEDTWVDEEVVDKTFTLETGIATIGQALIDTGLLNTEWSSWRTINSRVTGSSTNSSTSTSGTGASQIVNQISGTFKVFERAFGDRKFDGTENLVGTFSSQSEAQAAINSIKRGFIVSDAVAEVRTAGVIETTTTTTTTNFEDTLARERYEATLGLTTFEADLGDFVTDFSIIPYIRPQSIRLYATGLKGNTRFYVFFDGEDMSAYVTPMNQNIPAEIAGNLSEEGYLEYLASMASEGDPVFSDASGEVVAILRLPEEGKRFRTGVKEVVLSDVRNTITNTVTSYAKSTFVSNGVNVKKQGTILATTTAQIDRKLVKETQTVNRSTTSTSRSSITKEQPSTESTTIRGVEVVGPSCSAYSFYVDVNNSSMGVFLSSVDIWLEQLHPTLGILVEVREISSDGGITRNVIPGSNVTLKRDDPRLKTSADASLATRINFKTPIFLFNKTQYALVIRAEGLNPDTYFFVSELGGTDLITGEVITSRGLKGTFFTTNNNLNWDPVPDVDLKVRFNRAVFDPAVTGSAVFVNDDREFITSSDIPQSFFRTGELVKGSEKLTLTVIGGTDSVSANDIIREASTGHEATVLSVSGTDIFTDGNGFRYVLGANVAIYDSANTIKDINATISTVDFGIGTMGKLYRANNSFIIEHSNGKFFEGCKITSGLSDRYIDVPTAPAANNVEAHTITMPYSITPNPYFPATKLRESVKTGAEALEDLIASSNSTVTGYASFPIGQPPGSSGTFPECTLDSFHTFEYSLVNINPSFITYDSTTQVAYELQTMDTGLNIDPYVSIQLQDIDYNEVKTILSRSKEVELLNGSKSLKLRATLSTTTQFLSPVIDDRLSTFTTVDNIVNANTSGEDSYQGGGALDAKYISQIVTLSEENEAEDLLVYLAEYRPQLTEIYVWARFRNTTYDDESIYLKDWIPLATNKTRFSSSTNKRNFIDFQYSIPDANLTGPFGEFQYTRADNNVYTGYTQFQLKVGLASEDKAIAPKIGQLRSIALQV